MKLNDIKLYFDNKKLPNEVILDQATKLTNTSVFVKTHIRILESNPGNSRYLPYYKRLIKLVEILKTAQ